MRIGKISLLALAVLATPAMAAERTGFYIGGDVGQSNWNVTQSDANTFTRRRRWLLFNLRRLRRTGL